MNDELDAGLDADADARGRPRAEVRRARASSSRSSTRASRRCSQTTQSLREALSSTKARGQWGERMAEDVLRLAGFVENVNYRKQRALEGHAASPTSRSCCPNELLLHMDVKFPLDNYLRFCDADVRPRAQALHGRLPARRRGAGEGAERARVHRRRRRHGRLRAAVHPQRAAVRVHPRARRRRSSTTRCGSASCSARRSRSSRCSR